MITIDRPLNQEELISTTLGSLQAYSSCTLCDDRFSHTIPIFMDK